MSGRIATFCILFSLALTCGFSLPAHGMNCTSEAASRLIFGQYDPRSSVPLDVQGNLSIQCTPSNPGEVLDLTTTLAGAADWQFYLRNLETGERLRIGLYKDSARVKSIDSLSLFSVRIPLATAITFTIPLYGRIPALQNVSIGSYQADFSVLINY